MVAELTIIPLPIETIQWGTPEDFSQRAMEFKNSKDPVKGLNWVVEFVKSDDTHFACVFNGPQEKYFHLVAAL